ncbi:hypothetical protein Tco_1397357, partial [Tanacetum coccineum]
DNLHAEVAHLSAALNQATVLEAEKNEEILRLKTTPPEFASFFCGQFQDLVRKFLASDKFSRVQGELFSLAESVGFERGLSMHQTKDEFATVLKKMANFMPSAQDRLAEASPLVSRTDYAFLLNLYRLSFSLSLKNWLIRTTSPFKGCSCFSSYHKGVDCDTCFQILRVDGSDPKMTDDTVAAKSGHAFVQGISVTLEDVVELVEVGSGRASSGPNDVVVALSVGEKGDGLVPSFAAGEEAAANSSGV